MNLNSDTAKGRGVRTGIQAVIGFVVGLGAAVWAVPGVADAVWQYTTTNLTNVLVIIGLPSATTGVVSWVWNRFFRPEVPN